jgi:hypothetical protein
MYINRIDAEPLAKKRLRPFDTEWHRATARIAETAHDRAA